MSVLVTGATGAVGSALAESLAHAGLPAVLAARDPARIPVPECSGYETRKLDYDDASTYAEALRGVHSVFLVAPQADPASHFRMAPFIKEFAGAQVKHVVVNSAVNSGFDDEFTLRRIESMVEDTGCSWTHLRCQFYTHSAPGGFFLSTGRPGEFARPAGTGRVAFVDIRDLVEASTVVLDNPGAHSGKAYVFTGPEALDWERLGELSTQYVGSSVRYRAVTAEEYRSMARALGIPEEVIEFFMRLFHAIEIGRAAGLSSTYEQLTGKKPRSYDQFVAEKCG